MPVWTTTPERLTSHVPSNLGPASLSNFLPAHLTFMFFLYLTFHYPEISENRKYILPIFTDPALCVIPGTQELLSIHWVELIPNFLHSMLAPSYMVMLVNINLRFAPLLFTGKQWTIPSTAGLREVFMYKYRHMKK